MKRPAFLPALLALALMTATGMAQGQRGPGRRTAPSSPPTTRVRGGSQGSPATAPRAIPGLPPPSKEAIAAAAEAEEPIAGPGLLLNFQGASLSEVLTYLSETAGFVIVQETPVQGTINLTSRQPLTPEEAIDTLNSVLIDKGYTAVRNGRVLKIISSRDALKHGDTRVFTGNQPEQIPRKDNIVTQIIPIRYGEAAKLVENLRPLLPEGSSIGANDSSNAILLTDTQANIRRIVQIVQALDTSVANISTITVFPLNFADAKQVATTITQLYAIPAGNNQQGNQGGRGGRGGRGGGGGGGGGPGGGGGFPGFGGGGPDGPGGGRGGNQGSAQSEARTAAARVVAVSDEQSNSVIVSCAEDLVPGIRAMIQEIDVSITADSETRFFRLENADATELAATISKLYSDTGTTNAGNNQGGQPGFGFPFGGQPQSTSTTKSTRALRQAQVNAVGDPRTNVLLITASHESMTDIAGMIGQLDATPAKKQRVYTYAMRHGDPGTLADVLRGILGQPTTKQQIDRLNDRQNAGAAISTDLSGGLGGGQGGGGGGGGR